jgi:hypothetical protein
MFWDALCAAIILENIGEEKPIIVVFRPNVATGHRGYLYDLSRPPAAVPSLVRGRISGWYAGRRTFFEFGPDVAGPMT